MNRGEDPSVAQSSLKARTCWLCPGRCSLSLALLSCCSVLAPKKQLNMGVRRGSPRRCSPLWAQSHFWHGLPSKEREPTPERVVHAPRARPAAKDGFGGCNMELGCKEAEITAACPPLPRRAVGFPPGAV